MSRVAQFLIVAALVVSIGLHWAVLQSAAWVGMAVAYSVEKGSLAEGLSDTFDGEHPCPLCKVVDKGKQNDKKSNAKAPIKKFEMLVLRRIYFSFPQGVSIRYATLDERAMMVASAPLRAPPRLGLV